MSDINIHNGSSTQLLCPHSALRVSKVIRLYESRVINIEEIKQRLFEIWQGSNTTFK